MVDCYLYYNDKSSYCQQLCSFIYKEQKEGFTPLSSIDNLYVPINSCSAHITDSRKLGDIKLTAYVGGIMPVKYRRYILFCKLQSADAHALSFGVCHSRFYAFINKKQTGHIIEDFSKMMCLT